MFSVYYSPVHLFSSIQFSCSAQCQLQRLSQLKQSPITLQYTHADVVIATDVTPIHWAFSLQGSGLLLSISGSWLGSMCRVHITIQELQAGVLMLCRMAFQLSAKVLFLQLDNSTAKAYLGGFNLNEASR